MVENGYTVGYSWVFHSVLEKVMLEGVTLGKYQVTEKTATKNIAEYYLGKRIQSDIPSDQVIIKRIVPALSDIASFNDMLFNEYKLAEYLIHDNIIKILGMEEYQNDNYLIFEYTPGQNLERVLRQGIRKKKPIPIEISVQIICKAACALTHAYGVKDQNNQGLKIIHRNITPENIWYAYSGIIKIRDFGIALSSLTSKGTENKPPHTNVAYMSPEFISGKPLNARSDIFSLGVILWELATGKRLFTSSDQSEIMQQITDGQIPNAKEHNPNIPTELNNIITKMIARNPEDRFNNCQEVYDALSTFAYKFGTTTTGEGLSAYIKPLFKGISDETLQGDAEDASYEQVEDENDLIGDDDDDVNLGDVVSFISKSKRAIGEDEEESQFALVEDHKFEDRFNTKPAYSPSPEDDYQEFVSTREYDPELISKTFEQKSKFQAGETESTAPQKKFEEIESPTTEVSYPTSTNSSPLPSSAPPP